MFSLQKKVCDLTLSLMVVYLLLGGRPREIPLIYTNRLGEEVAIPAKRDDIARYNYFLKPPFLKVFNYF
jgi:hypothetical protein